MIKIKIIIPLIAIILLVTGGIFVYSNYYPILFLLKNNFDATATVPNTNISFKYPSNGFYGIPIVVLDPDVSPGEDVTQIKQINFYYSTPKDPKKVSEYIDFSISRIMERGEVNGDYTLENAVGRSLENSPHSVSRYETVNDHEFYIFRPIDNMSDEQSWMAFFLQDDGVYRLTINYSKPINNKYGKEGDTTESVAAYKNNDLLFEKILKNINF